MMFIGVAGAVYAEVGLFMQGIASLTSTNWGYMLNTALHQVGAVFSAKYTALLAPAFAITLPQIGSILFANAVDKTQRGVTATERCLLFRNHEKT